MTALPGTDRERTVDTRALAWATYPECHVSYLCGVHVTPVWVTPSVPLLGAHGSLMASDADLSH